MIKIRHIPEVIYCKIQRTLYPGAIKAVNKEYWAWSDRICTYYDIILQDDFIVSCLTNGEIDIHKPGYRSIVLYPEEFKEIIFT